MEERYHGQATRELHAGQTPDRETVARAVPIYQTTSYCYPCAQEAADVFSGTAEGFTYTRIENPTVRVLEELELAYAVTVTPRLSSSFAAIAPAATRPMVSRPEDRPPPR